MAKTRRNASIPEETVPETRSDPSALFNGLDQIDLFVYVGIFLVTLIVPFLFSRLTTENFLTPKEFVAKMSMAVLGAAFCLKFLFHGRISLVKTRLDMPLALFIGLWVLSIFWNYNVPSAIRDLRGCFLILLLFPLIINVVRTRWQFDGILWAIVLAGVFTSLLGIMEAYNLYFRWDPNLGWFRFARDEIFNGQIDYSAWYFPLFPQLASKNYDMASIVSTFGNRNYLGTFAMFAAFVPLSFVFYYQNPILRASSLGCFIIMAIGLFITRCRAAAIGIVLGVGFMFAMIAYLQVAVLNRNWKYLQRSAAFFVGVGVILLIITVLAASTSSFSMVDKLKKTFTLDRLTSNTYERVWVWYATYQSFAKNPFRWILGSGFGSFKHFFPLQEADTFDDQNKETFTSVTFRQTHNDWLQLISELGLVGFSLFLWLCWRFYSGIIGAIRRDLELEGDQACIRGRHLLLMGLGTAMFTQLVAAVPDFPFHRIETALYVVIVFSLVSIYCESGFFQRQAPTVTLAQMDFAVPLGVLGIIAGLMAFNFEYQCWRADEMVRDAEYRVQSRDAAQIAEAKTRLLEAISRDGLPGDPYLKIATIFEMEGKAKEAMEWSEKAWKNINFNARSTYHSVIFRMMHVAYHVLNDRQQAMEIARKGQYMTCGDARSIYYFYIGKIAMDTGDLPTAEYGFTRAAQYTPFAIQGSANLAVVLATQQKWQEAYTLAASVSATIGGNDPTMLDVVGICATNLGLLATAEVALRRCVELRPDHPVFRRDLGITLLRVNKIDEAHRHLEDALLSSALPASLKPEIEGFLATTTTHLWASANTAAQQGNPIEAIRLLRVLNDSRILPANAKAEVAKALATLGAIPPEKIPGSTNPGLNPGVPLLPPTPPGVLRETPGPVPTPTPTAVSTNATPANADDPFVHPVDSPTSASAPPSQ
jgi:tetratricopeptide (TPR) repeat protein